MQNAIYLLYMIHKHTDIVIHDNFKLNFILYTYYIHNTHTQHYCNMHHPPSILLYTFINIPSELGSCNNF